MSTAQANLFEWKQEVNRRLAEHRSRKGAAAAGPRMVSAEHRSASLRGAEAAARVAERFAHAPRYSDMLVEGARDLHADDERFMAAAARPAAEPAIARVETAVHPAPPPQAAPQAPPKMCAPAAVVEPAVAEERIPIGHAAQAPQDSHEAVRLFGGAAAAGLLEPPTGKWDSTNAVEDTQVNEQEPAHGNLIEFPRELVATRKIRPRLVEGPFAALPGAQLSIFEVDPGAVSTVAEPAAPRTAPEWNQPEWSGINLDPQPEPETAATPGPAAAASVAAEIELAPISRRVLALVVDATLIGAAVIAAGAAFAANASAFPAPRQMGIAAAAAFVAATVLYELLFFTLARATPGMRYARIGLSTFANQRPTREQRWRRLAAMALSVLPAGLGLLWSLFDEESLCWHDRLSQTYLKNS